MTYIYSTTRYVYCIVHRVYMNSTVTDILPSQKHKMSIFKNSNSFSWMAKLLGIISWLSGDNVTNWYYHEESVFFVFVAKMLNTRDDLGIRVTQVQNLAKYMGTRNSKTKWPLTLAHVHVFGYVHMNKFISGKCDSLHLYVLCTIAVDGKWVYCSYNEWLVQA